MLELGADVNAAQGTGPDCAPRDYSGGGGGRNYNGWVCGWTPLHGAAARGANTIVKFLVDHGARLDVEDRTGKTPLRVAEFTSLNATAYIRESTARLLGELMSEKGLAGR
jgi:ankyrin repeat protein